MTNLSGTNLNNGAAVGPQGEGRESPSSFPKYPAYKDSGVEWLGDVPEGWSVASLRFFADLITGITPPSDDLSNYAEEGWSWIRPEDLDDSGKPVLASKFLTDQGLAFCRKVKGQSTLICCIGTIGKLGFIETDACTNQQITAVVPRQGGRFYFYAMHALKPAFDAYATGNVLRILNSERLGSVEVAVPIKSEAESIARFLDHETARIDALIEEQQRLIELLKEKRQAVISHAVTKGLDPTAPMKDSGVEWLGKVPAHWLVTKLSFITSRIGSGKTPSGGADAYVDDGVTFIRSQNVYDEGLRLDDCVFIDEETDSEMAWSRVQPLDVLINITGASIGRTCIFPENIGKANVNQHVCVIRLSSPKNNAEWVSEALKATPTKNQVDISQTGAAREGLNFEQLAGFWICVPPLDEMVPILEYIRKKRALIEQLVNEAEASINLLQERRSALISAAVTGKIDVRSWQPPASTQAPKLEVAEAD